MKQGEIPPIVEKMKTIEEKELFGSFSFGQGILFRKRDAASGVGENQSDGTVYGKQSGQDGKDSRSDFGLQPEPEFP